MRLLWWFSNTIRLRPLFLKYFMFFFSKFSEARHHKITIFLPFPAIFCTFFIAWVPSNLAFSGTKTTRIFHTRMQSCVQSFLKYDFAQWAKNRKKSFQLCEFYCALIPLFFFVMSGLRWRWKHFSGANVLVLSTLTFFRQRLGLSLRLLERPLRSSP